MRRVPALSNLHRHGQIDGTLQCLQDALGTHRIEEQRRSLAVLDDLRRGTAHVEVDDVGDAEALDIGGGTRHGFRFIAEKLHRQRTLARIGLKHFERALVSVVDAVRADHLRVDERAAHLVDEDAVCHVRHAGHRCEKDGDGKIEPAELHSAFLS